MGGGRERGRKRSRREINPKEISNEKWQNFVAFVLVPLNYAYIMQILEFNYNRENLLSESYLSTFFFSLSFFFSVSLSLSLFVVRRPSLYFIILYFNIHFIKNNGMASQSFKRTRIYRWYLSFCNYCQREIVLL